MIVILTESEKGLKEAVDESVHVILVNSIIPLDAPGDADAGLSSSPIRCGKCVMCDGSTMTVNVRCLSRCDRDEIGMWWNMFKLIQTSIDCLALLMKVISLPFRSSYLL